MGESFRDRQAKLNWPDACSGYKPEVGTYEPCKHGFPQTGACRGLGGTPICCKEEVCGTLYEWFGGKPYDCCNAQNPCDCKRAVTEG